MTAGVETDLVDRFLAAVAAGDRDHAAALLSDDVELLWVRTRLHGAAPVLDWIMSDAAPGVYRAGLWTNGSATAEGILVTGRVPTAQASTAARVTDRIGGMLCVDVAAGKLVRIRHQPVGPGRPGPTPLRLTGQMQRAINGALAAMRPLQMAHMADDGPVISTRGSFSCLDDRRLGFWMRDRAGRLAAAIALNPHVALVYSDMTVRMNLLLRGRAAISEAQEIRSRIFDAAHPGEQEHDHLKVGAAVVIELDVVEGICANDPELTTDGVNMLRAVAAG